MVWNVLKSVMITTSVCRGRTNIDGHQGYSEMEFEEFERRCESAKTRFKLSAGVNLETFDTILSGTNHI